jgi:hypothetical protein
MVKEPRLKITSNVRSGVNTDVHFVGTRPTVEAPEVACWRGKRCVDLFYGKSINPCIGMDRPSSSTLLIVHLQGGTLTRLRKTTKLFLVAGVAALALSALGAASASATIVPAKFSSTGGIKMTSTGITVRRSGIEPQSCTQFGTYLGWAEGNQFFGSNTSFEYTKFTCPSGKEFQLRIVGSTTFNTVTGVYTVTIGGNGISQWSPWGQYLQSTSPGTTATWVNGSGSTASTITFSNATVGKTLEGEKPLSVEGTFKATTESGGLLTLSH